MPLGDLEDEMMVKILIVAQDQVLIDDLKREMSSEKSFKVAVAANGFETGIQVESWHLDCIIIDCSIGKVEAMQICKNLREDPDFSEAILITLLPEDGHPITYDRAKADEVFKKPFDASVLEERVRELVGSKELP